MVLKYQTYIFEVSPFQSKFRGAFALGVVIVNAGTVIISAAVKMDILESAEPVDSCEPDDARRMTKSS